MGLSIINSWLNNLPHILCRSRLFATRCRCNQLMHKMWKKSACLCKPICLCVSLSGAFPSSRRSVRLICFNLWQNEGRPHLGKIWWDKAFLWKACAIKRVWSVEWKIMSGCSAFWLAETDFFHKKTHRPITQQKQTHNRVSIDTT